MAGGVCLGMSRILREVNISNPGEPKRSYHLREVNDVIAFVLNLERPIISSVLEINEESRSIDLDVRPHERAYVLRRRQSDVDYTDVFHIDSGGPSICKLPPPPECSILPTIWR